MDRQEMYEAGRESWIGDFYQEHARDHTDEEIEAAEVDFMDIYLDMSRGCY